MPAGMVRPRASQVPPLGADAIAEYQRAGWHITAGGRVCAGATTGPCAACSRPTRRYRLGGGPLCRSCRPKPEGDIRR
jgi:hypothetical protein